MYSMKDLNKSLISPHLFATFEDYKTYAKIKFELEISKQNVA